MMNIPERKTLNDTEMFEDVVRAILSVMGDEAVRIVLYGSVARGDNTWESDVDIAVLTDGNNDRDKDTTNKLADVIVPLIWKHNTVFSVITIDEKHYKDWLFDLPFYYNIDEEGIILWKRKIA